MYDIENRATISLFLHTLLNPKYYESIEGYKPRNHHFTETVKAHLPGTWRITAEKGVWRRASPATMNIPSRGFKIHISTTFSLAQETLKRVVPVLVAHEVVFKFLVDDYILGLSHTQNFPMGSSGKFITAYPRDAARFKMAIKAVAQATETMDGPYILSDRAFNGSKVVFYRYGGFKRKEVLAVNGQKTPYIQSDHGEWTPDPRQPFFSLPAGVKDPFGDPPAPPSAILLNGRYQVDSVMSRSNKGGVYLALDQQTRTRVVIKEARPFINQNADQPFDAVRSLQNEYQALELLQETGVSPKPLGYFTDWEHHFLVMEYIEGTPLSSLRAQENFSLMLNTKYSQADVIRYCKDIIAIAETLLEGLRRIHEKGVVLVDLAPQNILFLEDSATICFIDFETAYLNKEGKGLRSSVGTLGFMSEARRDQNEPTVQDDFFALNGVIANLIFPVQFFFSLCPEAKRPFYADLFKVKGLPPVLLEFLESILDGPKAAEQELQTLKASLVAPRLPRPKRELPDDQKIEENVEAIVEHIINTADYANPRRIFPSDYRVFQTNPLSLAYGAMGVALFLNRAMGETPEALKAELKTRCRKMSNQDYPPGLFLGSSGIAWALDVIGLPELASEVMKKSA